MKMSDIKAQPISWLRKSIDSDPSFCVEAGTPVTKAADELLKTPRHIIAVVKDGVVQAIATRTDIIKSVVSLAKIKLEPNTPIIDVANVKNLIKITKDDTVGKLLTTILDNKFENLLVVDKDGKFFGIANRLKLASELEELTS